MMRLVWGTVVGTPSDASALQKLDIELDDGSSGVAVSYPALVGTVALGDRVLINTTAVDLGLGTGGAHFVVATAGGGGRELARGVVLDQPSGGHVMKLRYTPLQRDVVAVESPESPHHEAMRKATRLEGLPVVCCSLHSQVPLVAAAVKSARPEASVV
ncbi:MAG: DUF3866 family protein, partial [Coriobacteriales bacterium]|nr:DUF3866 family protein [Coriobacteriales bacterium]